MKRIYLIILALLFATPPAYAVFTGGDVDWDGAYFEVNPAAGDPVSQGDDHIRQTKFMTRYRGETEHDWGTFNSVGNDTGRHHFGSARTYFQNAAPAVIVEADRDGSTTLDDARLWVDANDGRTLYIRDQTGVASDSAGTTWDPVSAVPTNSIILWAQSQGDENCDGVLTNGDCPCGFTADHTFDLVGIRGADVAGVDPDISDTPGVLCDATPGAGCGAGAAAEYDDTLDTAEMPSHTHTIDNRVNIGGTEVYYGQAGAAAGTNTGATGGGTTHYHPFQTVLFCKKN